MVRLRCVVSLAVLVQMLRINYNFIKLFFLIINFNLFPDFLMIYSKSCCNQTNAYCSVLPCYFAGTICPGEYSPVPYFFSSACNSSCQTCGFRQLQVLSVDATNGLYFGFNLADAGLSPSAQT